MTLPQQSSSYNIFFAKVSADAGALLCSTLLGGGNDEYWIEDVVAIGGGKAVTLPRSSRSVIATRWSPK